jgi:hypothetical protein
MSTKHHLNKDFKQSDKALTPEETQLLLKKRLIWQHLAQKKIKKAIKSKLKINAMDD